MNDNTTRLLIAHLDDPNIMDILAAKLGPSINTGLVVRMGKTLEDDLPLVEFTSIEEAFRAMCCLMEDPDLGGMEFDFEKDYCEAPYDNNA